MFGVVLVAAACAGALLLWKGRFSPSCGACASRDSAEEEPHGIWAVK